MKHDSCRLWLSRLADRESKKGPRAPLALRRFAHYGGEEQLSIRCRSVGGPNIGTPEIAITVTANSDGRLASFSSWGAEMLWDGARPGIAAPQTRSAPRNR